MKQSGHKPLISVVVPVYGTEALFDRCMKSLLAQTYDALEILVVNDGSPGDIRERIRPYLGTSSGRTVRFADGEKNLGLLRARVRGAALARGEYLAFADSDDYVSPDYYRSLLSRALETNADITIGRTVWEDGGSRYIYNLHESSLSFDLLEGEEIRERYFGQETCCYSWHTVWNKLYRKDLWDVCAPVFEAVHEHIVMTEDIFFSSLLFFHADRVARAYYDAYFYCVNESASTNAGGITAERFAENLHDICYVFREVESYLSQKGASREILTHLRNGRAHYAVMWGSLAGHVFQGEELAYAGTLVKELCADPGRRKPSDEYFFESIRTPWTGGLEYIKKQITEAPEKTVSFDVFDTLLCRPFYEPEDLRRLLDTRFSELSGSSLSFARIRTEGEALARRLYREEKGFEDITLDEIYTVLSFRYGFPSAWMEEMKTEEKRLEKRFCRVRRTGKELLELAFFSGKQVILITDMYLDRETLEDLLRKNGITGYGQLFISSEERLLKRDGKLFRRVLDKTGIASDEILHIGDGWQSDMEGAAAAGIRHIFLPKAKEVFENRIQGCPTGRCADIGSAACGSISYDKVRQELGFRCMQAMTANRYFDNPYRPFLERSDVNADPDLAGYSLLGMHILGVAKWLRETCRDYGYGTIVFFARDGFLPMRAFQLCKAALGEAENSGRSEKNPEMMYMQASRKMLLPLMAASPSDWYQIPAEYRAHTPRTMTEVLSFADRYAEMDRVTAEEKEEADSLWIRILESASLEPDRPFASAEAYHCFLRLFQKFRYDRGRHRKNIRLLEEYYSSLPADSASFDMGYSGRIQAAVSKAAGHPVDGMFIHEDLDTSVRMKRKGSFRLHVFYPFRPVISGLMREYLFSDPSGSCVGMEEIKGKAVPVLEEMPHACPDRLVVECLQRSALAFAEQYAREFAGFPEAFAFSPMEVSLPFEGFLRCPARADMNMFAASRSEDLVYGARENINIEDFFLQEVQEAGWDPYGVHADAASYPQDSGELEEKDQEAGKEERESRISELQEKQNRRILALIHGSPRWKRALIWLLTDRTMLMEKIRGLREHG